MVHVGLCRLGELVCGGAMHVSQGSLCWWWLNGCSVSGPCAVSWQIMDGGEGDQAADGACKQQPCLLPCCDGAQNGGRVMVNGKVQLPLFHIL